MGSKIVITALSERDLETGLMLTADTDMGHRLGVAFHISMGLNLLATALEEGERPDVIVMSHEDDDATASFLAEACRLSPGTRIVVVTDTALADMTHPHVVTLHPDHLTEKFEDAVTRALAERTYA